MIANMLKSLVLEEQIETTVCKAKELRRHAEKLITLAKKGGLSQKRQANAVLQVKHKAMNSKEWRAFREGKKEKAPERQVISKLFENLGPRFVQRAGGYTRIIKSKNRVGDNAPMCILQYLSE